MRRISLCLLGMTCAGLAACSEGRKASGQDVPAEALCSTCHGSADNAAPPMDTRGHASTTLRGVGAHQAHLGGGDIAAGVPCATCHVVPQATADAGHRDTDLPAEVTFGGLARAGGLEPSVFVEGQGDTAIVSCRATYCHGAALVGGMLTAPLWNALDPAPFRACDACHGKPPTTTRSGATHPDNPQCSACHGEVVDEDGTIREKAKHIDGTVQVSAAGCTDCHGSGQDPAPPKGTHGETDESAAAVGAHQAHLTARHGLADKVVCTECHAVPLAPSSPGHIDATPGAEVRFGTLGSHDTQDPAYDATTRTCSNVYCHGATLSGGAVAAPVWAPPGDGSVACTACHGNPPPLPHPQVARCGECHRPTAKTEGGLDDASKHVDGVLQVRSSTGCNACHGSADNAAPPVDTEGRSDTTLPSVGAHQAHLKASGLSSAVPCETCHAVPARLDSPGHLDGQVEVDLSGLAKADGATPSWSTADATCVTTYCHGATLSGGTLTRPAWTKVDGTQAECGTCHGLPPAAPHPAASNCEACHGETAGPDLAIAHPEKHVDGIVETAGGCTSCHGSLDNPAPPVDTQGRSETTWVTVGAHQSHLKATAGLAAPVACTACHPVPSRVSSPGHDDGTTQVVFAGIATADGATGAWDRGRATCAGTYCHGATLPGGTHTEPAWTKVAQDEAKCGSCHGLPPALPHPQSDRCGQCHTETIGGDGTIAHPEKHVDGIVEVEMGQACASCHGGPEGPQPPVDLAGRSETTRVSVGAHASHALGSRLFAKVACNECHVVPTSTSSPGHVDTALPAEVSFGSIARTDGAAPAWDRTSATCTNAYCHGSTMNGGTHTTPLWTNVGAGEVACGTCHGLPPAPPHPVSTKCGQCHDTADLSGAIVKPEQHVDGTVELTAMGCASCHGSSDNPAPPVDTVGGSSPALVGVGAHQSHLKSASGLSSPVACAECHVVPKDTDSTGHLDTALPAEVTFGALATTGGVTPAWNRATGTCTNAYCHGATLPGGTLPTPTWTKVDGTQAACGTCHGAPPPPPHVQFDRCGLCHTETATVQGTIAHPEKHIDGVLEVNLDVSCSACHGNVDNAAPPADTTGGSATALTSVGAHQAHLKAAGGLSVPVACSECHRVPATPQDPGHDDTARPAEITWGPLATTGGASPAWSEADGTCANSYCHGATLPGGSHTTPVWTRVGSGEAACGTCHGAPPPPPHVQSTHCALCHETVAADGSIAKRDKHVDGVLEVTVTPSCNACHGNAGNAAPPVDTTGGSSEATRGVGAHQSHLMATRGLARAVACTSCHVVPAVATDPGHADSALPAEVVFSGLATTDGAMPAFNGATLTCNGAYCHGATLGGGTHTQPKWTATDGSQIVCGSCHGNPPPEPHPQSDTCAACHSETVAADNSIASPDKHIDGIVEVSFSETCTSCHGSSDNPAPPADTTHGTDTALRSVGAHQSHLKASSRLSDPMLCDECHVVPAATTSPGHLDGALPAEITFGTLSKRDGATPAWDATTLKCRNTYCHGATKAGGSNTAPTWTTVDGTQAACGTCHGLPPAAPHPNTTKCSLCHTQTASADGGIAHPDKHVDGTVEVNANVACNSCHGSADNAAPPVDVAGGSAVTRRGVGAHQAHVKGTRGIGAPVACSQCHVDPETTLDPGHMDTPLPAEVTWGTLAAADGASPQWDGTALKCAGTYCHGTTLKGGTTTSPSWTTVDGSQVACTSCHGNPPPSPHPLASNCAACHPQTANAAGGIADATKHVDGIVEVDSNPACIACHGSTTNAAPPVDTTGGSATTRRGVGAHQQHLQAAHGLALPVACTDCHAVPGAASDAGHVDTALPAELTWGAKAKLGGATPSWNGGTRTCSSTYCHGATLPGGLATAPVWVQTDGTQVACASCHGAPPPSPHPAGTDCSSCHTTASATGGIAKPEQHIDGVVQVEASGACDSCHGSAANAAPPVDTAGNGASSFRGVGAHQSHLLGSRSVGKPVACTECHVVPAAVASAGHRDTPLPAELTWGTLATSDGASPSWNSTTLQCANTYCHGATLGGGTKIAPTWTDTDGSEVACGTCHGNPPALPHPQADNCHACHSLTVNVLNQVATPANHVNGTVEMTATTDCSTCHGSVANDAPPVDTHGASATTLRGVGAHQPHLQGLSNLSSPIACTECHRVPAATLATGHVDTASPAEVTFGALAKTGGLVPAFSTTAFDCTNTWCHGASLSLAGGSDKTPIWTTVDGTQDACGTCHASATSGMVRPHPVGAAGSTCATCHGTTMSNNTAFLDRTKHVNGVVDIAPPAGQSLACNGVCHGVTGGTSPQNQAPPADTQGLTATTVKSVGAHQNHLTTGTGRIADAMACNECHAVPTAVPDASVTTHLNKAVDVNFTIGTRSKKVTGTAYSTTAATCTKSYCHGGWTNSGAPSAPNTVATFTNTTLGTCSTMCHALPPSTGRHTNVGNHVGVACGRCHSTVAATSGQAILDTAAARSLHVNGNPDVQMSGSGETWNASTRSCDPSCHGAKSWGTRVLPL